MGIKILKDEDVPLLIKFFHEDGVDGYKFSTSGSNKILNDLTLRKGFFEFELLGVAEVEGREHEKIKGLIMFKCPNEKSNSTALSMEYIYLPGNTEDTERFIQTAVKLIQDNLFFYSKIKVILTNQDLEVDLVQKAIRSGLYQKEADFGLSERNYQIYSIIF